MKTSLFLVSCLLITTGFGDAAPLQTFEIEEPLKHQWLEEVVHFPFDVKDGAGSLVLTNEKDEKVAWQFSDLKRDNAKKRLRGNVWTVVTLAPGGKAQFQLHRKSNAEAKQPASDLAIGREGDNWIVTNNRISIRVPQWPQLKAPQKLASLPAPVSAIRTSDKTDWLGGAQWFNDGTELQVKQAKTEIIERGNIRVTVRQSLEFVDGRTYSADIQLSSGQDVALISETSTADAPQAGWRFSMSPGLGANHVLWHNHWGTKTNNKTWALNDTPVDFSKENVIVPIRGWSHWWIQDFTTWAGFYQQGADSFVGAIAMRPSRWSPGGWDGFDRTQIPITARAGGELDLTFGLLASTQKAADKPKDAANGTAAPATVTPMHREWGLTVGNVRDNVIDVNDTKLTIEQRTLKLRKQLIKQSEWPLDEVKDFAFNFKQANANRKHPFLLIAAEDIERVRRQAKTIPAVKAQVDAAKELVRRTSGLPTLEKEGEEAFYTKHYIGNAMADYLAEAYIGSDDVQYGKMLAAAVKLSARDLRDTYIEKPYRPSLGAFGPWVTKSFASLLFNYDLIADSGLLTPEEKHEVYNTLVLAAHICSHPDYWNPERGLASANPNMTSSIRLPLGLLSIFLAGHPNSDAWLKGAEDELKRELKDWVNAGGAWIEGPHYQMASEDGMMLLAQALRNIDRKDYLNDPKFKELNEYYGFLLTPPDRRFPANKGYELHTPTQFISGIQPPMVLPAIGDTMAGMLTPVNGWMAMATAKTDPEYSKRQQWFWKAQNYNYANGNRASGMTLGLTDAELPAEPPAALQGAFPGFGSVSRTSWTDPKASYVAHRTGPNLHHYHNDYNSIVLYAKGAPLCLDFGNMYQPVQRFEPQYHNRVQFIPPPGKDVGSSGDLVETRSLPKTIDYSYGLSRGSSNQQDHRYLLLVKSADPLGANYVVMRDHTVDGVPDQLYSFNLWCLSKEPQVNGNTVHFPGQFDVDLDLHFLSPAVNEIKTDRWDWKQTIALWGPFPEEQYGVHVPKTGSKEDYFSVLYPRANGQAEAKVTAFANGASARVGHMEGEDFFLPSPGKPAEAKEGDLSLKGEIAFVRRGNNGGIRLAIVKGEGAVASGNWGLSSNGAVAVEIKGNAITGESSGPAQQVVLTLPEDFGAAVLTVDGKEATGARAGRTLAFDLAAGTHNFAVGR